MLLQLFLYMYELFLSAFLIKKTFRCCQTDGRAFRADDGDDEAMSKSSCCTQVTARRWYRAACQHAQFFSRFVRNRSWMYRCNKKQRELVRILLLYNGDFSKGEWDLTGFLPPNLIIMPVYQYVNNICRKEQRENLARRLFVRSYSQPTFSLKKYLASDERRSIDSLMSVESVARYARPTGREVLATALLVLVRHIHCWMIPNE